MISNNYLTVGADQNLYNKNIYCLYLLLLLLFDIYCSCYIFMFNRSLAFCIVFCRFLFVHLPFLFYFGLCIVCHLLFLVTPLITFFVVIFVCMTAYHFQIYIQYTYIVEKYIIYLHEL